MAGLEAISSPALNSSDDSEARWRSALQSADLVTALAAIPPPAAPGLRGPPRARNHYPSSIVHRSRPEHSFLQNPVELSNAARSVEKVAGAQVVTDATLLAAVSNDSGLRLTPLPEPADVGAFALGVFTVFVPTDR
jgi:hypothetical protein